MSKEMTALERLRNRDFPLMIATLPPIPATKEGYSEKDLFDIIEKALKAFEIIKEKLVCLKAIRLNGKVEEYNTFVDLTNSSPYQLTKEEYDLLKEILK